MIPPHLGEVKVKGVCLGLVDDAYRFRMRATMQSNHSAFKFGHRVVTRYRFKQRDLELRDPSHRRSWGGRTWRRSGRAGIVGIRIERERHWRRVLSTEGTEPSTELLPGYNSASTTQSIKRNEPTVSGTDQAKEHSNFF